MKIDKPYSSKDINSPGVYKIVNLINNSCYIGSSINLRLRKNQHSNMLRKNKHSNQKLQNSVNKYGFDNFVFCILENCNKSEVRFIEQKYLDSEKPTLNISSKVDPLICEKVIEERSKKARVKYFLISPEGIHMCTNNLKAFCQDHNLARDQLAHLCLDKARSSKIIYYKGWFITKDPEQLKEENRYSKEEWYQNNVDKYRLAREEYITYMWDTTTDKQYIIGNIKNATHLTLHEFCNEFNLSKEAIRSHFNRNKYNYKQFVIYREYKHLIQPSLEFLQDYYNQHKTFKVRKQRRCEYKYIATSPTGEIFIIEKDLKSFCIANDLDPSGFLKVANRKLKSIKKWTVEKQPLNN